jgi:hypothetical protein
MIVMWEKLIDVLPRLRTAASIVGLVVCLGAFVAVNTISPKNVEAQLAAGAVGVTIIVFGQIFYFLKLIPSKQRAPYVVAMFLIFCCFAAGLIWLTARLVARTSIDAVQLQAADQQTANTLDDLLLTWRHAGDDRAVKVRLADALNGTRSPEMTVRSGQQKVVIPKSYVTSVWPQTSLDERLQANVEFYGDDFSQAFGPFEIAVALKILYFIEGGQVSIYSMIGNQRVSHNFDAKCVGWPIRQLKQTAVEPESVSIKAERGGGKAAFPNGFIPEPASVKCVYFGRYPPNLIKYENLNKS